jgi:hypothetical protein
VKDYPAEISYFQSESYREFIPQLAFANASKTSLNKVSMREGALSLAYMYISLTSGRPDPSSFKTPIQIATVSLQLATNN